MSEEINPEKEPMVIHDSVDGKVYSPTMGDFDPETVCRQISASIEKIHVGGLKKEDFFPTFLISETGQEAGHSWTQDESHLGFIYGYVFGHMLANFEKNKDTKLEWTCRDMTEEEKVDAAKEAEESERALREDYPDLAQKIEDLIGEADDDDMGFEPPQEWRPESDTEGYDPTE